MEVTPSQAGTTKKAIEPMEVTPTKPTAKTTPPAPGKKRRRAHSPDPWDSPPASKCSSLPAWPLTPVRIGPRAGSELSPVKTDGVKRFKRDEAKGANYSEGDKKRNN